MTPRLEPSIDADARAAVRAAARAAVRYDAARTPDAIARRARIRDANARAAAARYPTLSPADAAERYADDMNAYNS
jgi:hypothetical protein